MQTIDFDMAIGPQASGEKKAGGRQGVHAVNLSEDTADGQSWSQEAEAQKEAEPEATVRKAQGQSTGQEPEKQLSRAGTSSVSIQKLPPWALLEWPCSLTSDWKTSAVAGLWGCD